MIHVGRQMFFPYFLSALPISKFFISFMIKSPLISPRICRIFIFQRSKSFISCALFPDKVCCFSQSEHALYGNFIMRTSHSMNFTNQNKKFRNVYSARQPVHVKACTTCNPYIADIKPSPVDHS